MYPLLHTLVGYDAVVLFNNMILLLLVVLTTAAVLLASPHRRALPHRFPPPRLFLLLPSPCPAASPVSSCSSSFMVGGLIFNGVLVFWVDVLLFVCPEDRWRPDKRRQA